jgi:hypothetical protein
LRFNDKSCFLQPEFKYQGSITFFQKSLEFLSILCENATQSLSEFWEGKCYIFPPFYLLNDNSLILILGNSSNIEDLLNIFHIFFEPISFSVDHNRFISSFGCSPLHSIDFLHPIGTNSKIEEWPVRFENELIQLFKIGSKKLFLLFISFFSLSGY